MKLPVSIWTILAPVIAWLLFIFKPDIIGGVFAIILSISLIGGVLAAVHHAEVVAHRVGEPYGTLLLAVAITVIEVSLIVSLMLAGGPDSATLARDTVYAAIMIILTGIIGLCLMIGGFRFREQSFIRSGVAAALITLIAITVLTLILPNYTTSIAGPFYNRSQLIFIAFVSLVLYVAFILVQAVRHRDYFLPPEDDPNIDHASPPSNKATSISAVLLLVSLGAVVLLAKTMAPVLEDAVTSFGAPKSVVGVIVALDILLPDGVAAIRAARRNRLQTSLNLALGSALASIGLTIPAVAVASIFGGLTITMGIDTKSTVLLILALLTIMLSFGTGRTNILQGIVLLVIFATYLFTTVVP